MSFLLVIVATVFLFSGLFLTRDLELIFVSIGCSALAGLVLVAAVLRSRPKPGAVEAVAVDGTAGAADAPSQWEGAAGTAPSEDSTFPIPGYDDLEVVEILPKLAELDVRALEAVRAREASGRAHPWILARIDALVESEAETGELEGVGGGATGRSRALTEPEWSPSESDWSASDFELDSGSDFEETARDFPIDYYHDLRVPEILPLLTGLDAADLKAVRAEEEANKNRAGILSRIDALLGRGSASAPARPAAKATAKAPAKATKAAQGPSKSALNLALGDYDTLTVAQIVAQLGGLSAAELRAVRTYEKRNKARAGVLTKIEAALTRPR